MLLVAPPWQPPDVASVELARVGAMLRARGIEVEELFGASLFPPCASAPFILEHYGRHLFAPASTACDGLVRDVVADTELSGVVLRGVEPTADALGIDERDLRDRFRRDLDGAGVCLERLQARAAADPDGIVAFWTTSDDRVEAALALARRLKRARPGVRTVLGGAHRLLDPLPDVDIVCVSDGAAVPLVEALRGARPLADVPGIEWREPSRRVRRNPARPDPDRRPLVDEVAALARRYPAARISSRIECRASAAELAALSAAGLRRAEVRLESFSDALLAELHPGCSALDHAQLLKWLAQSGLETRYELVIQHPADRAQWYLDMAELVPFLHHLPPPERIVSLQRGARHDGGRMAGYQAFVDAVVQWLAPWQPGRLAFEDRGEHIEVRDRRSTLIEEVTAVAGPEARLFRHLDRHRSRGELAAAFPGVDLDALLERWLRRRWICRVGDRYLSVVPLS